MNMKFVLGMAQRFLRWGLRAVLADTFRGLILVGTGFY